MKTFLFAVKRTKWERDLSTYGSEKELKRIYEIQDHAFDRVYKSHTRQKEALNRLRETVTDCDFKFRDELASIDFSGYMCVASLGGDNHFVYVSRLAKSPILGINSDPETSRGELLAGNVNSFLEFVKRMPEDKNLAADYFSRSVSENWSRIDCSLVLADGTSQEIGCCTSEFSIRNKFPEYMSRLLSRQIGANSNGGPPLREEKSSGLLAVTGAGSTGWFKNCLPESERQKSVFSRDSNFFKVIAREAQRPEGARVVQAGETLELISEMDGEIVSDADHELSYLFPYGATARFSLSNQPLRVIARY